MKKQEGASNLGKSQHQNGSALRKTDQSTTSSATNLDVANRSSGDIFSIGEDINALEQYGITPEIYEKYKKMTD